MPIFFILLCVSFTAVSVSAETIENFDPIKVTAPKVKDAPATNIGGDSSALLKNNPGISLQTGGGFSSRPAIQGMTDDRVNIKIDGTSVSNACPNHMNSTMSYIDPSKIEEISVLPGITPVSEGGDSIGGTILVKSKQVKFTDGEIKRTVEFNSYFKSNNENMGASVNAALTGEDFQIGYSGFDEKANNYRKGGGDRLHSTLFNQNNQTIDLAKVMMNGVVSLKLNRANVPYEGFINQRMDLTDNSSDSATLNYKGKYKTTLVDTTFFLRKTEHEMDVLPSERDGEMPMKTNATDSGYSLKFVNVSRDNHSVGFGHELIHHKLDDYWPGLPGVTDIMGPGTFQNINNGTRDRIAFYAELDSDWSADTTTNIGIRSETVKMNTGSVHGYNETDNLPDDAAFFNAQSHKKTDHNLDLTFTVTNKITPNFDIELGVAQKMRSPNMYERYAWAGLVTDPTDPNDMESMSASMDMLMINWFGDGNGYVGNVDLKPERAYKTSASFIAHDEAKKEWQVSLSPYYSSVKNYIDANFLGTLNDNNYLQFANHDAEIFGLDLAAKSQVSSELSFSLTGSATRGYRKDGKADLYHIMPMNGSVGAKYALKKISFFTDITLVDSKKQVNEMRNEPETAGYALMGIGSSFEISHYVTLQIQVTNLFDKEYNLPLGGIDLVNDSTARNAVSGVGRSVNFALTLKNL